MSDIFFSLNVSSYIEMFEQTEDLNKFNFSTIVGEVDDTGRALSPTNV